MEIKAGVEGMVLYDADGVDGVSDDIKVSAVEGITGACPWLAGYDHIFRHILIFFISNPEAAE